LLAATTDGNGRYGYLDPYEGGKLAVAEAARNLVCVGAKPLAVTDCLNFGNPQDPEIMWQFKECVRGISDACRAFATPVTGGNVSFYNESPRGAVDPTPVIGMIGVIGLRQETRDKGQGTRDGKYVPRPTAHVPSPITAHFKDEGDMIILLGETREELGGSEYLAVIHGRKAGRPPRVNLKHEAALHRVVLDAAAQGWLKSAHDCSDGGLAVTLSESCIIDDSRLIGARIDLSLVACRLSLRADALLFGESAGRLVISCEPQHADALQLLAKRQDIPVAIIGRVGGVRLAITPWIDTSVEALSETWRTGLLNAGTQARTGMGSGTF
jgi:phosphoribosylformylglycinamidine synthase